MLDNNKVCRKDEERHYCTICNVEPTDEVAIDLAELFKALGEPNRIKIMFLLFHSEQCVQEIADKLHMTQSNVSHQLKILKQAKLVNFRKEGKTSFYFLADDHVEKIFEQGFAHIIH